MSNGVVVLPRWKFMLLLAVGISISAGVAGRLHLLTEAGTRYVLDYAAGEVYKYPNAQHCPQSSQSDEVF